MPYLMAALGGALPTLCKLATHLATHLDATTITVGYFACMAVYGLIGAIVAVAFTPPNLKQALAIGISAPAIVTGLVDGARAAELSSGAGGLTPPAQVQTSPSVSPPLVPMLAADAIGSGIQPPATAFPTAASPAGLAPQPPKRLTFSYYPFRLGQSVASEPLTLSVIKVDGHEQTLSTFDSARPADIVTPLPADAKSFKIYGRHFATSADILPTGSSAVALKAEPQLRPSVTDDFLWALGGSRRFAVSGVTTKIN